MKSFSAWSLRTFLLAVVVVGVLGCDEPGHATKSNAAAKSHAASERGANQAELFGLLADNLNRLEEFDNSQTQVRDRLNHWARQNQRDAAWQVDSLVASLPDDVQELAVTKSLDQNDYSLDDIAFIQQAAWLRDISKHVRAGKFGDVDIAEELFDWTVRQIQLEPESYGKSPHLPRDILLLGRGTALQRAWIFMLLARQQQLDVVLLKVQPAGENKPPRYLAAVISNNQLYLFDPELGLPIPGPEGKGIATLAQAADDAAVLRQLDLDSDRPYPLTADDLKSVKAVVEGGPQYLSRRMRAIESRLSGKQKIVLTTTPSQVAAKVGKLAHVESCELWAEPFAVEGRKAALDPAGEQALLRELVIFTPQSPVRTARALQFKGQYDGDKGAKKHYLLARPSKQQLDEIEAHPELVLGGKENLSRYKPESVDKLIQQQIEVLKTAKECASFWLGLIAFDQQKYDVAVDFFVERTLKENPGGPWSAGARYNLARTYEAAGANDKAVELYMADKSPQRFGNLLRAKRLQGSTSASESQAKPSETPPTEQQSESPAQPDSDGAEK